MELTEILCLTPIPFIFISNNQVARSDDEQKIKPDDVEVHVITSDLVEVHPISFIFISNNQVARSDDEQMKPDDVQVHVITSDLADAPLQLYTSS